MYKKSSIILTLTSFGSGYTSAPSNNTSLCHAGTIHETGGFFNTLVITNNGSSYITNYQQCHYQVQVELGVLLHHLFKKIMLNLFLYLESWNGIPPLVINCLARFIGVSYNIDTNTYPYTNITIYSLRIFPQNFYKFLG